MDQNLLVNAGKILIDVLDQAGHPIETAVWIAVENDQWNLWLAPLQSMDRRAFYSAIATAMRSIWPRISPFDITDIKLLGPRDPMLKGLRRFGAVRPDMPVTLRDQPLDKFFLSEGLLLQTG